MFEGHDTTATALNFAFHMLGCHLDVQEKVYEEICAVCGDAEEITFEHLGQLKYLDCVLKETLRLHPSVPLISRVLGADETLGGFVVPSGVPVIVNMFSIHRDPRHWDDPEVFRPERYVGCQGEVIAPSLFCFCLIPLNPLTQTVKIYYF